MSEIVSFESPESTSIVRAEYDADTNTVMVEFKNGDHYHYPGFGSDLWHEWATSESKGSFFHKRIRPFLSGRKIDL